MEELSAATTKDVSLFISLTMGESIELEDSFKTIKEKTWNIESVIQELATQLGHLTSVINSLPGTISEEEKETKTKDELCDVLLQLNYLIYHYEIDYAYFSKRPEYREFNSSDLPTLWFYYSQLTDANMERSGYKEKKYHQGYLDINELIESLIMRMYLTILNYVKANKIDINLEFDNMCAGAKKYVRSKQTKRLEERQSTKSSRLRQQESEILDIYDEFGTQIGKCGKKETHEKGYWHKVVGCLFIDSEKNKIYLQLKNAEYNAVAHKDKLDISVGGHLQSGETIDTGIIREIREESGLITKPSDFFYIGKRDINVVASPNYIIREFSHIYLLDREYDLKQLHSVDGEVIYYVEFDIDQLLDYIESDTLIIKGKTPYGTKSFRRDDFIKGYLDDNVYALYLKAIKQYIGNGTPSDNKPIRLTLT